ncbi:MAG: exopolysaccharide biosynthesis protein [Zoogloeaceae bacterium]|nr:exopolysaccharide biosynthesis protein [Zoogloeaceae bacterium]
MDGTMGDAVGQSNRERLVWLSLLAMPLLFPVALPGMASVVGAFSLLIAFGLCVGQPVPLPQWLAKREMNARAKSLLKGMTSRVINIIASLGRPRMLRLSNTSARVLNGLILSVAGLTMIIPVPLISFDNVLPALSIVLISWGLRLRDGLMLLAGYLATLVAVASVVLLWWGGTLAVTELLSIVGFTPSVESH